MSRQRIIILIVALLVLGVIAYFIVISIKPKTVIPPTPGTTKPGLADLLGNILGANWWKDLFNKNEPAKYCDCFRIGYANDGELDVNCNVGGLFYEQDCA